MKMSDPASSAGKGRDMVLDAWRGISIVFVLVHHAVYFRFADIFRGFLERAVAGPVASMLWYADYALVEFSERSGPLGVKIFFVISGYIITKLLLDEEARSRTINIVGFYFRRVVRIIPALAVYVMSVFGFSLLGWVAYDIVGFFAALGFVCNTALHCGQTFVHTWTLSVEEQFYIVWPFLFLFVPKHRRSLFLVSSFVLFFALSASGLFISRGWINNPLSYACIALGALYATSPRWQSYVQRFGPVTLAALVGIVLALYQVPVLEEAGRQIYWFATPFAILVAITQSYRLAPYVPRMVAWFSALGMVSYSLYLWQEVFLMETRHYLVPSPLEWPLLLILIVPASYFFIEKPLTKWGRNVAHRKDRAMLPAP